MATAIQRRRGNTAQHASFTGLAGEITIDTEKNTIIVHDGVTAGGYALARADEVEALGGADITAVIAGNGLTGGATSGNATLDIGAGTGITVNADNVAVDMSAFSTTDLAEGTNLYYTDARVDSHLSGGTGITYTGGVIAVDSTIATKEFANTAASAAVSAVIDAAPAALDTLNELAAALGDDANFSATITASISTKLATADFDSTANTWIGTQSTTALAEGTNLYFTAARARGNISVTDAGGDGSMSYDSATGVITYTGPSATEVRAHLSGGTGVTITDGSIAIGQAVGTGDAVTFASITGPLTGDVIGNVTGGVTGNVTGTVSSLSNHDTGDLVEGTNLYFTAARARGNISASGDISYDSGTGVISFTERTDAEVRGLISASGDISYDSGTGVISFTERTDSEVRGLVSGGTGIDYNSSTGVITVDSTIATKDYANTAASAAVSAVIDAAPAALDTLNELAAALGDDANFSTTVTNSIATKLATADFDSTANTWIGTKSSTDLAEGTNLYFTAARARGNISVTDSGGDGSLSYNSSTGVITYTGPSASEVRSHFSAGTGVTLSNGQISIGQAVGTGSSVTFASITGPLTGNVTGNVTGNAGTSTKLATARTIALSGDVTGSTTFDGSGDVTISATIAANSVALGTDTTGNYVASVANGNYITGGSAGSEGATLTLAVDATTTATANKVAARDASGDLYANIFQGTATSARYADLAERYEADGIIEPGTVVCFGGEKEITACDHENDHAVAGVVSTDPAYMMNSDAGSDATHPYVALAGRVPCKVTGVVNKGDLMVAAGNGRAMANNNAKPGTIIGKAIAASAGGDAVIEVLVNMM